MVNSIFRTDDYGKKFYYEKDGKIKLLDYKTGEYETNGLSFNVKEINQDDYLKISITISSKEDFYVERFGFRLGIDCYMNKYPDWNDKYFPTALRCEKNGFWSCFISPLGKMFSVCSPSKIVSWKNEYNSIFGDVGHRIYTSSIEFINTYKQPERHPESPLFIGKNPITFELFYYQSKSKSDLFDFIEEYSGIKVPVVDKFTLEQDEALILNGKKSDILLKDGLNVIKNDNDAELSVFVRKYWLYYLDCARKSAEKCQQKPGTHTESWYGYFTMVAYAKVIKDKKYTEKLCNQFDEFFGVLTKGNDNKKKFRKKALPNRLQNVSCMLSLLADFYELTEDIKYLTWGSNLAAWLMKLQSNKDNSYRSHGTHYTCVIYPAKSMLEFALAEKSAGLIENYNKHFESAYKAIENLYIMKDNIQTEGQMTFEDGMISCESLQLGFLATILEDKNDKQRFADVAKEILNKHECLEQHILPDCRTRGCTSRYWEARYDINFFSNMLNSPHGWTSWKTYATYYLYILTGELNYLKDTMDTIGACMQCVDESGTLNWSYVADPCIVGMNLVKNCTKDNIRFEQEVVGEQYLPMISDWFVHDKNELVQQYIRYYKKPKTWKKDYGGSCDNDVHEHFKCLEETVFGKAFIHQVGDDDFVTYNCVKQGDGFISKDKNLKQIVVFSKNANKIVLNQKEYVLEHGINLVNV